MENKLWTFFDKRVHVEYNTYIFVCAYGLPNFCYIETLLKPQPLWPKRKKPPQKVQYLKMLFMYFVFQVVEMISELRSPLSAEVVVVETTTVTPSSPASQEEDKVAVKSKTSDRETELKVRIEPGIKSQDKLTLLHTMVSNWKITKRAYWK